MSIIAIENLVSVDHLSNIRKVIAEGPFVPVSAGLLPGAVSPNTAAQRPALQLDPRSEASAKAGELLALACRENSTFLAATWIEAMMSPQFYRYEPGMASGDRIDAAFIGTPPQQLRCDIEVTIVLAEEKTHDGGELLIDATGIPRRWKGRPGEGLVYPADMPRRVEPVIQGTLDVAVFLIQSMVRDPAQRRILFDIKETLDDLDAIAPPPSRTESLRRSYFNLIRMWA